MLTNQVKDIFIHQNLCKQFFLNTRAFTLLHRVENIPAKQNIAIDPQVSLVYKAISKMSNMSVDALIKYKKVNINPIDHYIIYNYDLTIRNTSIKQIPIQINEIKNGGLVIHKTNLTTLKNIPKVIEDSVAIMQNYKLTDLDFLPKHIGENLYLDDFYKEKYPEEYIRKHCYVGGRITYRQY